MKEIELLEKYFRLSDNQKDKFQQAYHLYLEWNQKINVISRKDIEKHLVERHFLHSLAIAKFLSFKPETKILDIGTGGGFPGIPLAILFPNVQFTLSDSIGKKIKVVNEVASALNLKNVQALVGRSEQINDKFDFIVSRAVTSFPQFMSFCKGKILHKDINAIPNGVIYLKGGDFSAELKKYRKAEVFPISDYFNEEFFETKKIIYLPF